MRLSHKSLEAMLLIKINDYAWNDIEREEIIKAATDKYLGEKNRKMKMSCEQVLSSPGPSTSTVESADISDSSSGSSSGEESDMSIHSESE